MTSATLDSDGSDPGGAVFVAELGVRGLPAPGLHAAVRPPSTTSAEPVTKLLAGEAR